MKPLVLALSLICALATTDRAAAQEEFLVFYNARVDCDTSFAFRTYFTDRPFILMSFDDPDLYASLVRELFDAEIRQPDDAKCDYELIGPAYSLFEAQRAMDYEKLDLPAYVDVIAFRYPAVGTAEDLRQRKLRGDSPYDPLKADSDCATDPSVSALQRLLPPSRRGFANPSTQDCPPQIAPQPQVTE